MSDYLFMLESHLTQGQHMVVAAVDKAAREADLPVFVTGGAMRDMLGGLPIRELDFTAQGDALSLAKTVAKKHRAKIVSSNNARRAAELLFPNGVTARMAMSCREHYTKPGAKPRVEEAPIHEDLLRRDFTVNSIALSMHPASRGLLLDPANGLADLEHRELRANNHYAFYDSPVRMMRLIRFRIRLGFSIEPRTEQQYENARLAGMESMITSEALAEELREIAAEPSAGEVIVAMAREGLAKLFSPALQDGKIDHTALARLDKAKQMIPFGVEIVRDPLGLLLAVLTAKFTPGDKSALARHLGLGRAAVHSWKKLVTDARKASRILKSKKLSQPSQIYLASRDVPGEWLLYLYVDSDERIVRDRIRNYLQKYLFSAQGVTDNDVASEGYEPGTAAFRKARQEMILAKLDGRKWRHPKAPPAAAAETASEAPATETPRRKTTASKSAPAAKVSARKSTASKSVPARKAPAKKKTPTKKKTAAKKKTVAKSPPAKKAPRKKTTVKKATRKKTTAKKTVAKNATGKKTAPQKTAAKKTVARKAAGRRTTAKKSVTKKAAAKKASRKTSAKKAARGKARRARG